MEWQQLPPHPRPPPARPKVKQHVQKLENCITNRPSWKTSCVIAVQLHYPLQAGGGAGGPGGGGGGSREGSLFHLLPLEFFSVVVYAESKFYDYL